MKINQALFSPHKSVRYATQAAGYVVTFILAVPIIIACLFAGWLLKLSENSAHRKKMRNRPSHRAGLHLP